MIPDLLANNLRLASAPKAPGEAECVPPLAARQAPGYLWIGCSDSRTPAHEIVGLHPGELFVYRNVANLAPSHDAKFLSTLQFAVEVVGVHDVIVCGHYGCGGVRAALAPDRGGLMDHWLRPVRSFCVRHAAELDAITDIDARVNAACELNVREQVAGLAKNPFVLEAWRRDQPLTVHGWIYGQQDGRLHDLEASVRSPAGRPSQ